LAAHPNQLGSISAFSVVLAVWRRDARWRPIWVAGAAAGLILSGSRTAILALALGGVVAAFLAIGRGGRRTAVLSTALVLTVTGLAVVGVGSRSLSTGWTADLATGNGRSTAWAITLEEWRRSPIVGYGPRLWSEDYRVRRGLNGLDWVGQAHNGYIQALGASGVLGFVALVAFILSLVAAGWRTRVTDSGVVLVVVTMMAATMMGENLLSLDAYPTAVLPTLVFALVVTSLNESYDGARKEPDRVQAVAVTPSSGAHTVRRSRTGRTAKRSTPARAGHHGGG
jgi:O-antigen ligase